MIFPLDYDKLLVFDMGWRGRINCCCCDRAEQQMGCADSKRQNARFVEPNHAHEFLRFSSFPCKAGLHSLNSVNHLNKYSYYADFARARMCQSAQLVRLDATLLIPCTVAMPLRLYLRHSLAHKREETELTSIDAHLVDETTGEVAVP